MTPAELAAKLAGIEYPVRIPKEIEAEAKAAGLVIVFGASDDLMEFRGAIDDEVGAWGGATVRMDAEGPLPDFDDVMEYGVHRDGKDRLRNYFRREGASKTVDALWCAADDCSWTYRTDIPHATFEVMEDGEIYCRGIVFSLAALDE